VTVGLGRISRGLRLPDSPQPTPAARSVSPGHLRPPGHADRRVLLGHSRSREIQAFQNRTWLPFVCLRRVEQSVHWSLNQPGLLPRYEYGPSQAVPQSRFRESEASPPSPALAQQTIFEANLVSASSSQCKPFLGYIGRVQAVARSASEANLHNRRHDIRSEQQQLCFCNSQWQVARDITFEHRSPINRGSIRPERKL
jgi:hypothetical protein